jgi:hypothetical protein
MTSVTITVVIHVDSRRLVSKCTQDPATPLARVLADVLAEHHLSGGVHDWVVRFGGVWLDWEQSLGNVARLACSARSLSLMALEILPYTAMLEETEGDEEPESGEFEAAPEGDADEDSGLLPSSDSGQFQTLPGQSGTNVTETPAPPLPPPPAPPLEAPTVREVPDFPVGRPVAASLPGREMATLRAPGEPAALLGSRPLLRASRVTAQKTPAVVERRASVRYYNRMNPERTYPLLVVISKQAIEEVIKKHVAQQESHGFQVALESVIQIEPVLPGCNCYPPKEYVTVKAEKVQAEFWVVPHVLGSLVKPRVILRQNGKLLAEVPLEMKVVKQTMTVVMGLCSLVMPYVSMFLKRFQLDWQSQQEKGFPLYSWVASEVLAALTPEVLGGALLVLTGLLYLWFRPRQRDVFWDIVERE